MINKVLKSIENNGLVIPRVQWCKNVYIGEHVIHLTDKRSTYKKICIYLNSNLKKIDKICVDHYHVEYIIENNRKHHKKIRSHHKMKAYMFYKHEYKIVNNNLEIEIMQNRT